MFHDAGQAGDRLVSVTDGTLFSHRVHVVGQGTVLNLNQRAFAGDHDLIQCVILFPHDDYADFACRVIVALALIKNMLEDQAKGCPLIPEGEVAQ